MDYHELEKTKVTELREMAQKYDDIVGASGIPKEQLVDILADKMGIEKPHKEVVGINKAKIKKEIKQLKKERDKVLEAKDRKELKIVRRKIHRMRRKLHAATKLK